MGERGRIPIAQLVELRQELLALGDLAVDNQQWNSAGDLVRLLREVATDVDNALFLARLKMWGPPAR